MSCKRKKRRSRTLPEGAVLGILEGIREPAESSDLSSLTTSLFQLVSSNVSERKAIMHKLSGGVETLIKTLQETEEPQVASNIVATLDCLAKHRYKGKLVKQGALPVVLSSLAHSARCQWCSDDILQLYHSLLLQLGTKDKRFAVMSRLNGVLPVSIGLLKRCQGNHGCLVTVLGVIKLMASNSNNAAHLGKHGCWSIVSKMLEGAAKKNYVTLRLCVDILASLFKHSRHRVSPPTESLTSKPSAQSCTCQLLSLHQHLYQTDKQCRHLPLRRAILACLKMAIGSGACLDAFQKANGLKILHSTALQAHADSGKGMKALGTLTCSVLRKALPSVHLPISSKHNPIQFTHPEIVSNQSPLLENQSNNCALHTSYSAPQLTNLQETEGTMKEGVCTPNSTSAKGAPSKPYIEVAVTTDTSASSGSQGLQSSGSDVSVCSRDTACTAQQISLFDNFFPEPEATKKLVKTQSSPLLVTLGLEESAQDLIHKRHASQQPPQHQDMLQMPRQQHWNYVDGSSLPSPVLSLPIVIPTASPQGEQADDRRDLAPLDQQALPLQKHSEAIGPPCQVLPKSVVDFKEVPAPQVFGHFTPASPEPLYKKTLAVERSVTLDDAARFIDHHSLINRTVYDLDVLTDANAMGSLTHQSLPSTSDSSGAVEPRSGKESEEWSKAVEGASSRTDEIINSVDGVCQLHDSIPPLEFESRFESGNLRKAIQVRPHEYDLLLNSDINSDHHHQWFYFKVSNMVAGQHYRFNIINCEKPNSQFNFGMQPVLYSVKEAKEGKPAWVRGASNITYYKNNYIRIEEVDEVAESTCHKGRKSYYTLTFSVDFPHAGDTCYLAYHYPYTYSMLLSDLDMLENTVDHSVVFYRRQILCSTLNGNSCPVLTITSQQKENNEDEGAKEYIVLSARVHPGESNSSWIMRGVLKHLLSGDPDAQALRSEFIFKVIPMLNPDGVINGSHRCSLWGQDLNRQWIRPNPAIHPTIYHAKGLLQWLTSHNKPPAVYCDFHGHSRKKNIFMYGCKSPGNSRIEEVLPQILANTAPAFSWKTCSFTVEKSKEATARVVVWRRLGIPRSYTMESTYCGTDQGPYKAWQITTEHLEEMGQYFCQALGALKSHAAEETACEQETETKQETKEPKSEASSDSPTTDSESSDTEEHSR